MVFSMPILLALGGLLLLLVRTGGLRVTHTLVAILLGAQISTTALASGVNAVVSAADHLLRTVLT